MAPRGNPLWRPAGAQHYLVPGQFGPTLPTRAISAAAGAPTAITPIDRDPAGSERFP